LGERLLCKQEVIGSIPIRSMEEMRTSAVRMPARRLAKEYAPGSDDG